MSQLSRLYQELKQRRVFRVATVYAAVAFVIWQAADFALPALRVPEWVATLVVVLTLLGFPIVVLLAWAFEVTPEGVRRTEPEVGDVVASHARASASRLLIRVLGEEYAESLERLTLGTPLDTIGYYQANAELCSRTGRPELPRCTTTRCGWSWRWPSAEALPRSGASATTSLWPMPDSASRTRRFRYCGSIRSTIRCAIIRAFRLSCSAGRRTRASARFTLVS
jgi:hypothetical protein